MHKKRGSRNLKMRFQTYNVGKKVDRFLISDRASQTDLWRRRVERPRERHSNLILFPPSHTPYHNKLPSPTKGRANGP